ITRLKFRYSLPSATSCAFVMLLYLGSCPDRTEGELEVSVDKLFDEGGIGNQMKQGDSVSGERGVDIQLVSEAADATTVIRAEVNDYLILYAYEFGVKYSICSRVVIMEMKDVLHALLRQFLVFKS
ncbi:hypothetical protein Tco_1048709, partial [Tanacetum coccineum]